jgi:hypothetical protein
MTTITGEDTVVELRSWCTCAIVAWQLVELPVTTTRGEDTHCPVGV